ncbi:MAG: glycosyl hydrolase [Gemmatimonadetes bacterium]|nr:glycosyl hydrolase [Gemmatimonadota bacterium]
MRHLVRAAAALMTVGMVASSFAPEALDAQAPITTDDMRSLYPRMIGPAVTAGRIHDVEALPHDPSTIFIGAASGGLWKTTNRGQTWKNVFADMPVSTFGDIAISRSHPNVLYAGTGEQNNRQSSSYGNGVYRSDDGGDSWRHVGLEGTRHTGKVQIHPTNPDIVFVGALGNLWAPSQERGVYKTTDGGRSWAKVLFVDEHTGVVDMAIDPTDPNTVYAAMYQRLRRTWGFNGGGPGSGIYKTTDGGRTWNELSGGIPAGDKGRIGIAISESNPRVLMALIEHADRDQQGTYRSEDGGLTWERVNAANGRPMYYSHIFIDPTNEDRVYTLATESAVSDDGGRSFRGIAFSPTYDVAIHADHHALWVDPTDPEHLYLGGDAGLNESYDGGVTFRRINNLPLSQFYAIDVDMRDPYWVYGGLQDNHSFMGPSETRRWAGIINDDWMQTGFSDGTYWQADPSDARYSYGSSSGGNYFRHDTRTGDLHDITPRPPLGESYRFDWLSPMMLSRHDPSVLYVAGNRLFTSHDRGSSWASTQDLSRQVDRDQLEMMGVRGSDITLSRNDGATSFGEATTLDESPLDAAILWVGFDDGNIQVSRNGGRDWVEVSGNVTGIADGTYVSRLTASAAARGTAYATFDAHQDGDFRPYVFRTRDFGQTWVALHRTLPEMGVVNVIVEHPDAHNTLFLGTEHHAFATTDGGANWARIPNLPTTHYDDMVIHPREKDLVLGTHGQGIWILDDTRAIAEWSAATAPVTVFSAAVATIQIYRKDTSYRGQDQFAGTNPVDGVEITYKLGAGDGVATLRVHNAGGSLVREMAVPATRGTHRVNWDLRHRMSDGAERWQRFVDPNLARPIGDRGPWVSPGTYIVTVTARGTTASARVEVRGDPDMPITLAMYESRERFMLDALALTDEIQAFSRANGSAGGGGRGRGGFGRGGGGMPTTPQAKLQAAARAVQQVYGSLNGGAVRPGTLYPPTQTQREQVLLARRLFEEAQREMGR